MSYTENLHETTLKMGYGLVQIIFLFKQMKISASSRLL